MGVTECSVQSMDVLNSQYARVFATLIIGDCACMAILFMAALR